MTYNKENIFAKILRKEIPAKVVYEDDYALAFEDVAPQAPVHILVIPKGDYTDFGDFVQKAPSSMQMGYFKAVQTVANQVSQTGYRLLMNTGKDSGQAVAHYHTHILAGRSFSDKII